jgi:probable HAF family extracellular repeat protein
MEEANVFVRFASCIIVAAMCGLAHAAPRYHITELDVLPGGLDSHAFGLNERGQVVGDSRLDRLGHIGRSRPVVWDSSGRPTELWSETLIGGSAADINNHGMIVGRYGSGSGIPQPTPGVPGGRAFVWSEETGRRDLGIQPFGNSMAAAINDSGQVVGTAEVFKTVVVDGEETLELQIHPFLWDAENGIRDLGTLGGTEAFAEDINALGQVVGRSTNEAGFTRAFIWDEVNGMRLLPSLANGGTRAAAINDFGIVLGSENGVGGVMWDLRSGSVFDVPGGLDLNNLGQAVGGPFLVEESFEVRMLSELIPPDSGWEINNAWAINDAGQIVGSGMFHEERRAFSMMLVPEPGAVRLTAIATLWLVITSLPRQRSPLVQRILSLHLKGVHDVVVKITPDGCPDAPILLPR